MKKLLRQVTIVLCNDSNITVTFDLPYPMTSFAAYQYAQRRLATNG